MTHMQLLTKFAKVTIFKLIQDIIGTFLLTKVLTRKNAPPSGGHVFQPKGIIYELVQDIIGMNLLTKFHEDWTINMASRVKNAPPLGSHVFEANFHEDQNINVASRVLTMKNAPPPGSHFFQPTGIIFDLVQDIIGMNLLTKFHEDWTINVASRVKNAPPLGSHVFQANVTIFELIQDIIETNLLFTRQMLTAHDRRQTTDKRRSQKLTMSTLCSGELKSNPQQGSIH
ncbi:hypothetical protein DPMN_088127 [Dreissena polymorpha]|uniref:Uncharacterized protein n=1 Tax=Dreissena polymorpha TaxID=45954 RepID=A0A9D4QX12_DREPO|nr:hypothetical protein DPMN_088127 [Dreissena polymorpha]